MPEDPILSPTEVAEILGIAVSTLRVWRRRSEFPEPIRIGPRRIGWRRSVIEQWLENQGGTEQ